MKTIEFKTKSGKTLTGEIVKNSANTLININGSKFFGTPTGLKSYNAESFLASFGQSGSVCEISISKEEKERIHRAMFPENVIVEVLSTEKFVDVHYTGEATVIRKTYKMLDGSTKVIENRKEH